MKPADFEEKDYEGPLYTQLLCGNHRICTPGQVFENAFGIDCALEAHHAILWDYFGYKNIPDGIALSDYRWGWVHRRYGKYRHMSKFPVNILIQAKRPDVLTGPHPIFKYRGIPKGYWRFHITEHQQPLLSRLSRQLKHRALVIYASPAFNTHSDLDDFTESKQIVEKSSFVNVERMEGHHTWNYDRPGTSGIAASELEWIDDEDFNLQLTLKLEYYNQESSAIQDLIMIDDAITETIKSLPENPICISFRRKLGKISNAALPNELLKFLRISIFFSLINVTWLVAERP